MSSANSDGFTLFPIWIPYIYLFFPSLIAVANTSKTMMNKTGENRHPCLIPDLRGNPFNFSLLSMITLCLAYMTVTILRYVSEEILP